MSHCFGRSAARAKYNYTSQDAFPTTQKYLHVVIDTNVLIDYCGIVEQFCADVEKAGYPILIIIPSVVLGELDGCVDIF